MKIFEKDYTWQENFMKQMKFKKHYNTDGVYWHEIIGDKALFDLSSIKDDESVITKYIFEKLIEYGKKLKSEELKSKLNL